MDWIQLTVTTTSEGVELVSEQLIEAGSAGTLIEDRQDALEYERSRPEGRGDILDESVIKNMPEQARVTGYYPADERARDRVADVRARMGALGDRAGADMGALTVEVKTVDDEDWAENWKRQYKPFRLGKHMVVKPGWCEYEGRPDDRIIEIDPGLAFGTGTHETTALCVELVEQYVKPGDRVIDVGTGTGILAIAAALNGAAAVLASDIDPMAVKVAAENVRLGGLEHVIETRQGDLLKAVDEVCDVLTANIIADVIVQLAAPVRAHIREGGVFICSGIARERQQAVLDALAAAGYRDIDVREQGEWAAIACIR